MGTNVVIQNAPFTPGYPAAPGPLLSMGSLGHFVGNHVTFQHTATSKATAAGAGCVLNNQGGFGCTDCIFRNCSKIGVGGGVNVGPLGTQVLVNPTFENCVGCACMRVSAGGGSGWYCDNDDVLSSEQALV